MLNNQNTSNLPLSNQGGLPGALIADLGGDPVNGMLDVIEQMGLRGISPAYQDPTYDLSPLPNPSTQLPISFGGVEITSSGPSKQPTTGFLEDHSSLDQLTGQGTGELQSVSAELQPGTHQVLWGVDEDDSQLFRLTDYTNPLGSLEDFGRLQIMQDGRAIKIRRVSAFTIDQDNQTAYIAVNRRAGRTKGPWIGKINLSQVQAGGPNEVTVVGSVDLRTNNDHRATIRGLDFDPITGQLFGLLTERGNDDLIILDKTTGQIQENRGSIATGREQVTRGEDLVFDDAGNLYISDSQDDELYLVNKFNADILETVDDRVEQGLGTSRRYQVEVEGLAWDPISQQMILTDEKQDLLGILSPESGNNQTIATLTSIGLTDVEGIDFQTIPGPGNQSPEAIADQYTLNEDAPLSVNASSGVLANDTDADGDSLTAMLVTGPTNGSLTLNPEGSFSYMPNANFNGADNFVYQVSDGQGGFNTATVNLLVNPVNDAPHLGDQSFSIPEDSANGLIVGTITGSDPDAEDTLSYAITAGNGAGVFAIDADTGEISVTDAAQLDFETQPLYSLTVEATDRGDLKDTGVITINLTDVDDENQSPVIVTTPTTEISLGSTIGGEAIDLSTWSAVNYPGSQGPANWEIQDASNTLLRQTNNSAPSIYIGDFELTNSKVSGTWKVDTTSDDDLMGFVFGYQDSEHFYLFDWKQRSQNDAIGFAEIGMSIKVVNADSPLTASDFWPTEGVPGRVTNLFHNTLGWDDFTEYDFSLEFFEGSFTITISETATGTELESVTIEDSTYLDGGFGFYNYSQDSVEYRGFTQESLILDTYTYDVDATDADGDTLTYDLVNGPDGMSIDAQTGLIEWDLLADDVGTYSIQVSVEDGNGGGDLQSYQLEVTAATASD